MGNSSDIDVSIASIWRAWRSFRQGKRKSRMISDFEYNLEANLLSLASDIQSGIYKHGTYRYFEVNDSKRRLIAVAEVRDRVVHRLLYEHLVNIYDKRFIYHVWSCRQGKGLTGAINVAQDNMRRYRNGWVVRSDIRKFFDNVDQTVLLEILARHLDIVALRLCKEVIISYRASGKQVGMAIGNLTSQIFANIYLNEFDRYVVHYLKPLAYIRYGDDFMSWWPNEVVAQSSLGRAKYFLSSKLVLSLNEGTTCIQPSYRKLHVLGIELWPNGRRLDARMLGRARTCLSIKNYQSYHELFRQHQPKATQDLLYRYIDRLFSKDINNGLLI